MAGDGNGCVEEVALYRGTAAALCAVLYRSAFRLQHLLGRPNAHDEGWRMACYAETVVWGSLAEEARQTDPPAGCAATHDLLVRLLDAADAAGEEYRGALRTGEAAAIDRGDERLAAALPAMVELRTALMGGRP